MSVTAPALSKSQVAYQSLRERILSHEYTPGYRLVLQTIADELGMSVVPVREAVRQLEAEGMVTFERNVGARVAMGDDSQYLDTMQVLSVIEGSATALAAPFLTSADISRARAINDRMRAMLKKFDGVSFTQLNREFHGLLFSRCPNARLRDLVETEWDRLDRLRASTFVFVPERSLKSVEEHEEILRCIETGVRNDRIERLARDHRTTTVAAYLAKQRGAANPVPLH